MKPLPPLQVGGDEDHRREAPSLRWFSVAPWDMTVTPTASRHSISIRCQP